MFQFLNNRYTTPQRVCHSGVLSASLPNSMSMRTCLPLGPGLLCPPPPPSSVIISLLFLSGADVLLMDHYCPWPGTLPNDAPSESQRSVWIRQRSLSDPALGPHSSAPAQPARCHKPSLWDCFSALTSSTPVGFLSLHTGSFLLDSKPNQG